MLSGDPWGWAVTLEIIGTLGGTIVTLSKAAASFGSALAMRAEWYAPATGRGMAFLAPLVLASSQAAGNLSAAPEITICPGQFRFASSTPVSSQRFCVVASSR